MTHRIFQRTDRGRAALLEEHELPAEALRLLMRLNGYTPGPAARPGRRPGAGAGRPDAAAGGGPGRAGHAEHPGAAPLGLERLVLRQAGGAAGLITA